MQLIKLTLRPGAQFHLGRQVPFDQSVLHSSDTQIHSDTLFSALVNIAAKVGCVDAVVKELKANAMSSAFYIMENGSHTPVYFLPRPTIPLLNCEKDYKTIKRKAFVSRGIFEKGIPLDHWEERKTELVAGKNWIATVHEMQELLGSAYEKGKSEEIQLYQMTNIPQVKVHTMEIENTYYQTGNLQIADNRKLFNTLSIHFYFLLQRKPCKELEAVINLLPLEGIGGQRSTGCGQVQSVKISENDLFGSIKGDAFLSLSKVIPTSQDVDKMGRNTFYQTTVRGGRIIDNAKDLRLKQIRMINEGAVFEQQVNGFVADLRPDGDTPYLRYGKAFLIPIPESMSHA